MTSSPLQPPNQNPAERRSGASASLTVGVIGGLGPEATLDFFAKVLRATPAERDQDHLHLIINNNPKVPNRNEAVAGTGPSCGPELAKSAQALERAGADLLVMPCNTAHAFAADIREAVQIPLMSLIDETASATRAQHPQLRRVGILATSGCLQAGLYREAFGRVGLETLEPSGAALERFMAALYDVKANRKEAARLVVRELAQNLVEEGAEALVAGCTEVPLVLSAEAVPVPLLESTDVLAHAVVRAALQGALTSEVAR